MQSIQHELACISSQGKPGRIASIRDLQKAASIENFVFKVDTDDAMYVNFTTGCVYFPVGDNDQYMPSFTRRSTWGQLKFYEEDVDDRYTLSNAEWEELKVVTVEDVLVWPDDDSADVFGIVECKQPSLAEMCNILQR
jgi:hypothetical protein